VQAMPALHMRTWQAIALPATADIPAPQAYTTLLELLVTYTCRHNNNPRGHHGCSPNAFTCQSKAYLCTATGQPPAHVWLVDGNLPVISMQHDTLQGHSITLCNTTYLAAYLNGCKPVVCKTAPAAAETATTTQKCPRMIYYTRLLKGSTAAATEL
jgi:hypothetical protein